MEPIFSKFDQPLSIYTFLVVDFGSPFGAAAPMSAEDRMDADLRSIYVGNVDYSATAQELEAHFHGCGSINRVTILCDKFSGHPKGFAYVEFGDKDSVQTAQALDDSLFKGRQIKVNAKRSNRPGISTTDRVPRGAMRGGGGFRGRGRGFGSCGGPFQGNSLDNAAGQFLQFSIYGLWQISFSLQLLLRLRVRVRLRLRLLLLLL